VLKRQNYKLSTSTQEIPPKNQFHNDFWILGTFSDETLGYEDDQIKSDKKWSDRKYTGFSEIPNRVIIGLSKSPTTPNMKYSNPKVKFLYRDEQTTICQNSSCEAMVPSSMAIYRKAGRAVPAADTHMGRTNGSAQSARPQWATIARHSGPTVRATVGHHCALRLRSTRATCITLFIVV
jgi:hypothetical protein